MPARHQPTPTPACLRKNQDPPSADNPSALAFYTPLLLFFFFCPLQWLLLAYCPRWALRSQCHGRSRRLGMNAPRTGFLYHQCRGTGTYQAPFPECQRRGEIYSAVPWTLCRPLGRSRRRRLRHLELRPGGGAPGAAISSPTCLAAGPVELSFEKYPDSIQQVSKSMRFASSLYSVQYICVYVWMDVV